MASPFLMLLAVVLGIVALGGVAFAFATPTNSRALKRAQAITDRSRATASRTRTAAADPALRRKQILKTLREEERRHRKASLSMVARLQQAGLPITPKVFWIASAGLGAVVMLLAVFLGQKAWIGLLFGVGAGLGLPRWVVSFLAKRRAKKFGEAFADASDIIVRGIKSGLPVHECLQVIARESPEPLASEFRRLVDSVSHGVTLEQALEKMHARMPLAELRFFTIVLSIQQKTGGNLAEALSNLSAVLRSRKLMREKIKAYSAEASASAMIIGSLPPGVVILISVTTPSYLSVLFHTTTGQLILGGAAIWMAIGVFIMKRMVSFKMTPQDLVDPANLIAALAAILAFAAIVTVAAPLLRRDGLDVRLKSVANRREELRRRSREALANPAAKENLLRRKDESLYKKVVERLDLSRLLEDPKVEQKLAEAGFRGPRPISAFYFFRFALPFGFAAATAFYLFVVTHFDLPTMSKLTMVMVGMTIGYYAPNIYVSNIAGKRRGNIVGAFPDALDLLLICVEAGMSIEAAIQKVSQEIGGSSIELAEELSLLVAELSYLPERRMAYEGLGKRINNPGVKSVSTAMIQAERYGTPLGAALRIMAKENRELRLTAAEKKAAALPAQLTVPMILFLLPVLFVVIMAPAAIRTMAIWH